MKPITKKITAFVLLFTIFFFAQSNRAEANPAVIVPGVIALGTVLIVGGALKYSAPANPVPNIMSNAGTLGRIAVATWNAATQYGTQQVNNKLVTLKASFNQLVAEVVTPSIAAGGQTPYPALRNALSNLDSGQGQMHPVSVGETLKVGGNFYKVDSLNYDDHTWNNPNGHPTYDCDGIATTATQFCYVYDYVDAIPPYANAGFLARQIGQWHIVDPPAPAPKTLAQLLQSRNSAISSAYSESAVASDIDQLIKDKPNVFTAVDTATPETDLDQAPPYVPPSTALPVGAVPPTTTLPVSTAATAAAQAASAKALTQAQAQASVDAYKNTHPGATAANDPVLANLEKALGEATTAATAASNVAAQTAAEAEIPLPDVNPDGLKAIDFSPFLTLQGVLATKFPFTLLSSIGSYLSVFSASSSAPVFHIPIYGNTITIDMSFMDSVATVSRYLIASLMAVGCVFYIVRRYTD